MLRAHALVFGCALLGIDAGLGAAACSTTTPDATHDASPDGLSGRKDAGVRGDATLEAGRHPEAGRDAAIDAGADVPGTVPWLTTLSVTATSEAGEAVSLVPPFTPATFDYYVLCHAGDNRLTVSTAASPGASSLIVRPVLSPSLSAQTVDLLARENDAIVVTATSDVASVEYWVRCLPHEMPPLVWTTSPEAGIPPPGYYVVGSQFPVGGLVGGYVMVLNGDGVPVWYAYSNTGDGVSGADSLLPEQISYVPLVVPDAEGEYFEERDLRTLATTKLTPGAGRGYSHDLRLLPNGDSLVIVDEVAEVDLTGLGVAVADGGTEPLGPNSIMLDCSLAEVAPDGHVVWSWKASQHFDPVASSTFPTFLTNAGWADGGLVVDTFHCNSVDIDPVSGDYLVSARQMDSIFFVDHTTGKVLWKMGGTAETKDGARLIPVDSPFFRQHDARLQPGWSKSTGGQISLYDDETEKPAVARAVVYDVALSDSGAPAEGGAEAGVAATLAWQCLGIAASDAEGSFRISADGSRVIGWGVPLAPLSQRLTFSEVDDGCHTLVSLAFGATRTTTYRAVKVPLSWFDLNILRNTAGAP